MIPGTFELSLTTPYLSRQVVFYEGEFKHNFVNKDRGKWWNWNSGAFEKTFSAPPDWFYTVLCDDNVKTSLQGVNHDIMRFIVTIIIITIIIVFIINIE